jgi:uncharacterized membrane protein
VNAGTVWLVVAATGLATIALKATGPLLLGGKPLPPRVTAVVGLLGPALLAALVATSTFALGRSLVIDERLAGMAVAAVAVWRRLPVLVVLALAAGTTAVLRGIG